MKKDFPLSALLIALLADAVEFWATPFIGYFLAVPLDIYLYSWARGYLNLNSKSDAKDAKTKLKNRLSKSLIFRILIEFIPILNFLPFSTLFVLMAYRDKQALDGNGNMV